MPNSDGITSASSSASAASRSSRFCLRCSCDEFLVERCGGKELWYTLGWTNIDVEKPMGKPVPNMIYIHHGFPHRTVSLQEAIQCVWDMMDDEDENGWLG